MPDSAPAETTETALPVAEERLVIDKRRIEGERVTVRLVTDVLDETVETALEEDHVSVERIPVERVIDTPPTIRTEGDVTIVPVVEERLVLERRLVLVEEVHIRRQRTSRQIAVPVDRRRQRAIVERTDAQSSPVPHEASNRGSTTDEPTNRAPRRLGCQHQEPHGHGLVRGP